MHKRLIELDVRIVTGHSLSALGNGEARFACVHTGRDLAVACTHVVPVTSREPDDGLWRDLTADPSGITTLVRIGDCRAPGIIATAVHDGHRRRGSSDSRPAVWSSGARGRAWSEGGV